jgi:site-specific DNA-methyltransferase (adenine-specific)
VGTNSREKTGYPTQKPLAILKRIVQASSRPGDVVLDPFAGSGTAGEAAHALGRRFIMIDSSSDAIEVMERRFAPLPDVRFVDISKRREAAHG